MKINTKGNKQKRVLMVTDRAIYNMSKGLFFDKLTCSRRGPIELENIDKISTCNITKQGIIHVLDGYDYHFFSEKCEEITDIVMRAFRAVCMHRRLKVEKLKKEHIEACRYSMDALELSNTANQAKSGKGRRLSRRERKSLSKRLSIDDIIQAKMSDLSEFPEEILSRVFHRLGLKDVSSLMLVNRRLNRIGRKHSRYWAACKNCSYPLFNKKRDLCFDEYLNILGHDGHSICTKELPEGISMSDEKHRLKDLDSNALIFFGGYYRKTFNEDLDYEKFEAFFSEAIVKHLFCKGCGLYLGFKIDTSEISLDAKTRAKEETFPLDSESLEAKDLETLDQMYSLIGELSKVHYLVENYLCWFDPEKERDQWKFLGCAELCCNRVKYYGNHKVKCNNIVGYSKDVISKDFHSHDIGDGDESALYMSKVELNNVAFGEKHAEYLSVGLMHYRDMKCKTCNGMLGWKFEEGGELESDYKTRNRTYQGRYGIVESVLGEVDDDHPYPDFPSDFKGACNRNKFSYINLKKDVQFWTLKFNQSDSEEEE